MSMEVNATKNIPQTDAKISFNPIFNKVCKRYFDTLFDQPVSIAS